jgi:hypothetical protein
VPASSRSLVLPKKPLYARDMTIRWACTAFKRRRARILPSLQRMGYAPSEASSTSHEGEEDRAVHHVALLDFSWDLVRWRDGG